jgi:16S rRNA (guanine966-N2)-methyltransferase
VRIISGKYKGKQIHPPHGFKARPTTDFSKEALFNILENNFEIETLSVLDLFSGTGSITYEFASRGALRITTVELNTLHYRFIRKMVEEMELLQVSPVRSDAMKIIKNPWESYDLIFADPPYDYKGLEALPDLILSGGLLEKGGWFILEHPSKIKFNNVPGIFDHRHYGSVNFSFFKTAE